MERSRTPFVLLEIFVIFFRFLRIYPLKSKIMGSMKITVVGSSPALAATHIFFSQNLVLGKFNFLIFLTFSKIPSGLLDFGFNPKKRVGGNCFPNATTFEFF